MFIQNLNVLFGLLDPSLDLGVILLLSRRGPPIAATRLLRHPPPKLQLCVSLRRRHKEFVRLLDERLFLGVQFVLISGYKHLSFLTFASARQLVKKTVQMRLRTICRDVALKHDFPPRPVVQGKPERKADSRLIGGNLRVIVQNLVTFPSEALIAALPGCPPLAID